MDDSLIREFMSLGCKSRKDAAICLQAYLDLCEVKKFWNVQYKFDEDMALLYIEAQKALSDLISIFIPKSATEDLSYRTMFKYLTLCQHSEIKSVYLLLVSTDSTCVYYKISQGLIEPEETTAKRFKENKHEALNTEIRKNRKLIEEAALCAVPLTIPKKLERDKEKAQTSQIQP